MQNKNNTPEEIWSALKKSQKVLMSLHPRPDGDSLGSCVAMKYVLEKMGKSAKIISKDPLTEDLEKLEISKEVECGKDLSEISWEGYDLVILLDHGTLQYYSDMSEKKLKECLVMNIDHHDANKRYGDIVYVEPDRPSACSVLIDLFNEVNFEVDKNLAEILMVGVATDCGFFNNEAANKSFGYADFLVKRGANYYLDTFIPFKGSTPMKIKKLQGILLSNIEEISIDGKKIAYSFLDKKNIEKYGFEISDMRLAVSILAGIEGIDFQMALYESEDEIKGSFRSVKIDVSKFASLLEGGGHKLAAGFVVRNSSLEEAKEKVLEVIKQVGFHNA